MSQHKSPQRKSSTGPEETHALTTKERERNVLRYLRNLNLEE